MKFNSSTFTQTAITLTLLTSAAVPVDAKEAVKYSATQEKQVSSEVEDAKYDADIYLDALDADGHLSLLEAESYTAKSHEQKAVAEPQVAETKVQKHTAQAKSKYSEQKVVAEPQVAETKVQKHTAQAKSKYSEAKYSTVEAADTHKTDIHSFENHTKVAASPKVKVDSHGGDHGASKAHGKDHNAGNDSFLTKHTTEIEFTFAILVIVVGLIASERFQRVQEQQTPITNESGNNNLGQFEES